MQARLMRAPSRVMVGATSGGRVPLCLTDTADPGARVEAAPSDGHASCPSLVEQRRRQVARVASEDWSGRLVADRYAIERELGRGGYATVYLAQDTDAKCAVALKVLREEFSGSRHAERFAIEIRLQREFSHPHILHVLDAGESAGRPYYVMPYVDGETLQDRLKRERRLPLEDVCRIGLALCDALGYAHDRQVVHRDVKPANVMLAGARVYLADFGIAKALRPLPGQPHSTTGVARGTLAYMSPEQATADREIDHRSDIYSLGCVLFETIAGQHPFYSADESRMLAMRFTETPDSLRRHRDAVPPALERAVLKALQREPADRWQSVREMREGLTSTGATSIQPRANAIAARQSYAWAIAASLALAGGVWYGRTWFGGSELRADSAAPTTAASEPIAVTSIAAPVRGVRTDTLLLGMSDRLVRSVEQSLDKWQGIPLRSLNDSVTRLSAPRTAFGREGARTAARRKGIRFLIAVALDPERGGHHVAATLIDVTSDTSTVLQVFTVPSAVAGNLDAAGQAIASSFLRRRGESFVPDDVNGTTHFVALREYQAATRFIGDWSLEHGAEHLRRAIDIDSRFGTAQLWLGQSLYWMRDSTSAALTAVRRAESLLAQGSVSSRHAAALRALLERRYDVACGTFESLTAQDSLSFTYWKNLGDCRLADSAVVRDETSPTGWRFRSSLSDALADYQRALALAPAARAKEELYATAANLLFTESGSIRLGMTVKRPFDTLAALPSLVGGVVRLYPFPLAAHRASVSGTVPRTMTQALRSQRKDLLALVNTWARQFPRSWTARSRLAAALEDLGEIGDGKAEYISALAEARLARRLADSDSARVRLANSEVRLLLKSSQYGAAALLADSLLAAEQNPAPDVAALLAPLAAMRGHASMAARLLEQSWRNERNEYASGVRLMSPDLRGALARLLVVTAIGDCGRTLEVANDDVERLIAVQVDSASRGAWRTTYLARLWTRQSPCTGGRSAQRVGTTPELLARMQSALVRRDTSAIRSMWSQIEKVRVGAAPGSYSLDATYQEAWVLAHCGLDTEAAKHLDLVLAAIPSGSTRLTLEVDQVTALVRALRLRGELYAREHNEEASARFQRQALELSGPPSAADGAVGASVRG